MACQVPVISSNTGGLPEINIHGETGFLSPVGDVDDMACAIRILENEETLAAFKERAFKQAQRFSLDRIMPLYEAYYIRVLEQASATA